MDTKTRRDWEKGPTTKTKDKRQNHRNKDNDKTKTREGKTRQDKMWWRRRSTIDGYLPNSLAIVCLRHHHHHAVSHVLGLPPPPPPPTHSSLPETILLPCPKEFSLGTPTFLKLLTVDSVSTSLPFKCLRHWDTIVPFISLIFCCQPSCILHFHLDVSIRVAASPSSRPRPQPRPWSPSRPRPTPR